MKKKDSKTSESELREKVEKLKQQVLETSKSSTKHPDTGLKEMVEKLEREIEYEYNEAAKALGLEDKVLMVREEVAKGRSSSDQLEHLKSEVAKNLPSAPNHTSLASKIDMLKELSKAFHLSNKVTNNDELRLEINKRFGEILSRPNVKRKIEKLKAEIANSGASNLDSNIELKEKAMQLSKELDSEFKAVLRSMGLQMVVNAFDGEVHMIIDNLVNSSDLKERIKRLKAEVEKLGNTPSEDSKTKIQGLVARNFRGSG